MNGRLWTCGWTIIQPLLRNSTDLNGLAGRSGLTIGSSFPLELIPLVSRTMSSSMPQSGHRCTRFEQGPNTSSEIACAERSQRRIVFWLFGGSSGEVKAIWSPSLSHARQWFGDPSDHHEKEAALVGAEGLAH